MTVLDVASPDATTAAATAVKWLNQQVNQIKPFVVESIQQATRLDSGNIALQVTLVTSPTRTFQFELELNPAIDTPIAFVKKRQLP
jgi:hypothetical protein